MQMKICFHTSYIHRNIDTYIYIHYKMLLPCKTHTKFFSVDLIRSITILKLLKAGIIEMNTYLYEHKGLLSEIG
jgi:hypothetical protein